MPIPVSRCWKRIRYLQTLSSSIGFSFALHGIRSTRKHKVTVTTISKGGNSLELLPQLLAQGKLSQ